MGSQIAVRSFAFYFGTPFLQRSENNHVHLAFSISFMKAMKELSQWAVKLKDNTSKAQKLLTFVCFYFFCRFEYLGEHHLSFMLQTWPSLFEREDLKEADPGSTYIELAGAYLLGFPVMFIQGSRKV